MTEYKESPELQFLRSLHEKLLRGQTQAALHSLEARIDQHQTEHNICARVLEHTGEEIRYAQAVRAFSQCAGEIAFLSVGLGDICLVANRLAQAGMLARQLVMIHGIDSELEKARHRYCANCVESLLSDLDDPDQKPGG